MSNRLRLMFILNKKNISIDKFCKKNNLSSYTDLVQYCKSNSLGVPPHEDVKHCFDNKKSVEKKIVTDKEKKIETKQSAPRRRRARKKSKE